MTRQLESALELARYGFRVFPAHGITDAGKCTCGKADCGKSAGKHPAITGWQRAATADEEQIRSWWSQNPFYNPAVVTGTNIRGDRGQHLVVLDVDGKAGMESLRRLEKENKPLPAAMTVRTGGGGVHYYFFSSERIGNSAGKLGDHLDIRGKGGYVIGPGGRHLSGRTYEWVEHRKPGTNGLVFELPGWITEKLNEKTRAKEQGTDASASGFVIPDGDIPEGTRNDSLFRYGCTLRGQCGKTMLEIAEILSDINRERCKPPLKKRELQRIIRQIDQYARGGDPESDFAESQETGLICAADIVPVETKFLLKPYIPEGKLTLIQGNPGEGKTAFACALAAKISSGEPFQGIPCEQGNVLMLSVEDDESELMQRIQANGGDLKHCFFVREASSLSFNSAAVEAYINRLKPKLVIFDPFQSFLGAKVDMHRANETRPVLAKLADLAARNECGMILICHMAKGLSDSPAVLRALGSTDIPAASRSIMQIGRLDDDPSQGLMVHVKCSNAAKGKSVIFRIGNKARIDLGGFSDKDENNFYTFGKKVASAAKNDYLYEDIQEACLKYLQEHKDGGYVLYSDLDVMLPPGVKMKYLLQTYASRLKEVGVVIRDFKRLSKGNAVLIIPGEMKILA